VGPKWRILLVMVLGFEGIAAVVALVGSGSGHRRAVSPEELRSIARCKLLGTEPELAAKLGLGR